MSYDALSPVDGRYFAEARPLAPFFSERALMQERMLVELEYLALLVRLGVAPKRGVPSLALSANEVKRIEGKVGHDVKAVELFLRKALKKSGAGSLSPYVHLGLTSEDVNSAAHARLLRGALVKVLVPAYSSLALRLAGLAAVEANSVMLARTHGRPAVPTTFGKEVSVFAVRFAERIAQLKSLRPMAKFSGAVGTYASFSLLGELDWPGALSKFVKGMGVDYSEYSTQVVPGERLSDILHCIMNINQLMVSLSRDLWMYQALDYVRFSRPGKVSSSTMPQKVNPVELENAEGQAEISTSMLVLPAYRLQVTRLQRDLSDSVIRRTIGQALAHSLIASKRVLTALSTLTVDRGAMKKDLMAHPEVMAEAAQVTMRLKGDDLGYEKVKSQVEAGKFRSPMSSEKYVGSAPELALGCPAVVRGLLSATPRRPSSGLEDTAAPRRSR